MNRSFIICVGRVRSKVLHHAAGTIVAADGYGYGDGRVAVARDSFGLENEIQIFHTVQKKGVGANVQEYSVLFFQLSLLRISPGLPLNGGQKSEH